MKKIAHGICQILSLINYRQQGINYTRLHIFVRAGKNYLDLELNDKKKEKLFYLAILFVFRFVTKQV